MIQAEHANYSDAQIMIKKIFANLQTFFLIWLVVIILNQIFIFGACFAPYCLIAAIPHTSIISAIITFYFVDNKTNQNISVNSQLPSNRSERSVNINSEPDVCADDLEDASPPYCSKCGSKMKLRTARKGHYQGKQFWGCEKFPKCNGILKID